MPVSYEIDGNLVSAKSYGIVTDRDIHEAVLQLVADPAHTPGCHELWDLTDYSSLEVSSRGVEEMVSMDLHYESNFQGGVIAVLAPSDLAFGMARIYQSLSDNSPVKVGVFRSMGEARDWLS